MYSKWYSIVIGVVLVLAGLDPWLPTGPEIMVMPLGGIIAIVLGVVGIVLGALELRGKKKQVSPTSPATPSSNQ